MCQEIGVAGLSILSYILGGCGYHTNHSQKSLPAMFHSSAFDALTLINSYPFYYTCTMISLSPTLSLNSSLVRLSTLQNCNYATVQFLIRLNLCSTVMQKASFDVFFCIFTAPLFPVCQ